MILRTLIRALDFIAHHLDKWETAARVKRLKAPEAKPAGCPDPRCPVCYPKLVVVLRAKFQPTPDRPAPDPWMAMVKEDIEDIFLDLEGKS